MMEPVRGPRSVRDVVLPRVGLSEQRVSKEQSIQSDEQEAAIPVGGPARTALTLLLIVHLFAVTVGVLAYSFPLSPLRSQLAEVPFIRPYLQLLHIDTAYNFHLTDGLEDDLDHFVVVLPQDASADPAGETSAALRLPERGMQPGIRRERFQQLAQRAAAGAEGDPVRPLLSKTIGGAMLRHADAPDGTYRFRVQRQRVVAREDVNSPDASRSDPYDASRFATAYEGAIILDGSGVYFTEIAPEEQRAGLRMDGEDDAATGGQP